MGHRRNVVIGAAVVGMSLVWAIAPAAAASPSRTTLTTSTPTIGVGSVAKLKAVVRQVTGTLQPSGTVTFREGTTATSPAVGPAVTLALVNSVETARLDLPSLAIGTHTFIATYSGSTAFNASTSLTTTIVVTAVAKTDTTTAASSATPDSLPGQEVKLKAVVKQDPAGPGKPTGTVTFSEGATNLGTAPLELIGAIETAKLTLPSLPVGVHSIIATYSGSSTFNGSTSDAITVTVAKGNPTCPLTNKLNTTTLRNVIAVVVEPPATQTLIPSGVVNFIIDGSAPQPFPLSTAGKAQISRLLTAGTAHTASVTYGGDTEYNTCSSTLAFTAQ
jgi:large repetitive protein